jgi:hypothetical protein
VSERDLDAEFERIIAGWDEEAPDPQLRAEADALGPPTDLMSDPTAAVDGAGQAKPAGADSGTDEGGSSVDVVGTDPAEPGSTPPQLSGDPGSPTTPPGQSGGVMGLPIAPNTSHVWRGGEPRRDDADDVLDAVDADDDHFVPPSEIELPSAENDPMYWAIVGGLVGGPLLLLYLLLFDRNGSGWWIVTGLAMLIVGFVLLVLRGGTERDPYDDGTRL